MRDYYKILGVSENATPSEIKEAYRRLVAQYHPDKNPEDIHATEFSKMFNEVYSILSDPHKRASYDSTRVATDVTETDPSSHTPIPQLGKPYDSKEQISIPGMISIILGSFSIFISIGMKLSGFIKENPINKMLGNHGGILFFIFYGPPLALSFLGYQIGTKYENLDYGTSRFGVKINIGAFILWLIVLGVS